MRSAVLIGTDFAYDSKGKLIPLEINTNVGWDMVNRKETVDEIFDFTDLSMYVRENAIKEILLEGKIVERCKDAIQKAIPHVTVSEATMGDYEEEHPNTTLFVRTAWSSQALVDTFAASKEKFKSLIKSEDFCEGFSEPSGNLPNLVVKAIDPQYDKLTYPKFYRADVSTLKVPHGFIVEPAVLNVDNLVEGRIPVFRNWSLFVAGENGDKIDTIYLGTYTKVCGDEFDESKLEYNSDGALVEGRGMFLSLDGLSTQWPADALVEASDEVLMSDGSWKKASELKVGDRVKSLKFEDSLDIRHHVGQLTTTEKELKKSFAEATVDFLTRTRGYRDFVEIKFDDKSDWFDTANSSYLVKRESGLEFDYISNLKKGDVVYFLKDGSKLATKTVESVGTVRKYVDTYNVGLAENHVFFSRGEGETSAFASLEHNDTADCSLEPKSQNGAFQTFISFDGTDAAKGTLNISTSGVSVTSGSIAKTFAKTSGTASVNGEYVNPNDYSSGKGGFTGCWYPLTGSNTWNISVPLTTVGSVKGVATIVRVGSADGNALDGSNTYWKFTEIGSTGSNVLWPVTFSSATGPCKLHVQVYQPSDIIQVTEPTGKNFEADGTVTSGNTTASISFPQGTGTKGNVSGSVTFSNSYISFASRSVGIDSTGKFDSAKESTIKYSTKMATNNTFKVRYNTVDTTVKTVVGSDCLISRYTVSQGALKPTLSVSQQNLEIYNEMTAPSSENLTINITSNAPWTASCSSSRGGWKLSKTSGTGNGTIVVQRDPDSFRLVYSYDGQVVGDGTVTIKTVTGEGADAVEVVRISRRTTQYFRPSVSVGPSLDLHRANLPCGKVRSDKLAMLVNIPDLTNSEYYVATTTDGSNPIVTEKVCMDCVPLNIQMMTAPNGQYAQQFTVGCSVQSNFSGELKLALLGTADVNYPGVGLTVGPWIENIGNISVEEITESDISESVPIPDNFGGKDDIAQPCWCLFVGSGSLENSQDVARVDLKISYTDAVTGEVVEQIENLYIASSEEIIESDGDEPEWLGNSQVPQVGSEYMFSFRGLLPDVYYKLITSPGVFASIDSDTSLVEKARTGEDWLANYTPFMVAVETNNSSDVRKLCVALVPENNGTVQDISKEEYWRDCDGGTSKNGKYYSYLYASQDGKPAAKKSNILNFECNPVEYSELDGTVEYDVTASSVYPLSSSLKITLVPQPNDDYGVDIYNPAEFSMGVGSSKVTFSSNFGWADLQKSYTDKAIVPGTVEVAIDSASDSVYEYVAGTVSVANLPSLGGSDTLYVKSGSSEIIQIGNNVPGLEVSCSSADYSCSLRYNTISSGGGRALQITNVTAKLSGASDAVVYLKRGGKVLAKRAVADPNRVIPVLFSDPAGTITKTLSAFSGQTVLLYTGSLIPKNYGLKADSYSTNVNWLTVMEAQNLNGTGSVYSVSAPAATASREGIITFKKDGCVSCEVTIKQEGLDAISAWFVPNGGDEVALGTSISLSTANAMTIVGKNYEYWFRISNPGEHPFKVVFSPDKTMTNVSLVLDAIVDTSDYCSASSATAILKIARTSTGVSLQRLGTLSIVAKDLGAAVLQDTVVNSTVY